MWRLAAWFLGLALLGGVAAWLAERPGQLTLRFAGWQIETSTAVAAFGLLLLLLAILLLYRIYAWFRQGPGTLRARRAEARRNKGYQALTRGLVAVAAGDPRAARREARRADSLLDGQPLSLLLSAQTAQLEGDEATARRRFEALAATPETEFLGVRGLLVLARRRGADAEALVLAQRAALLRPEAPWVLNELFDLQVHQGDWEAAEKTLAEAARRQAMSPEQQRRRQGVVLYQRALQAEDAGDVKQAVELARKAHEATPELVPATALAARLMAASGRGRRPRKLLQERWAREPHPDLAQAYLELEPEAETAAARLRRMEELAKHNPDHEESRLAVAASAIAAQEWETAEHQLAPFRAPTAAPGPRALRLLAALAERGQNDGEAARALLGRAAAAPPDPVWQCGNCGHRNAAWRPLCPNCDSFDSFGWRRPEDGPAPALRAAAPPAPADAPPPPERLFASEARPPEAASGGS